mgnify:CR=1 FL=1
MSVTVRGKKFQAAVHFNGKRYRKQFNSSKDAEVWVLETKANLVSGRAIDPVSKLSTKLPETLNEGIEYTYKHSWCRIKSGKEMKRNGHMVASHIGGDVPMADIDKSLIDELVHVLRTKGNKNGTINRKLTALSKILSTAEELGVIEKRPKIPYLKESTHRVRWYTDDELTAMVDYCNSEIGHSFGHYLNFMADTGLRQGEARSLRWEDRRWDDAIYIPNSKNGLPRAIPLSVKAKDALLFQSTLRLPCKDPNGPWAYLTPNLLRQNWEKVRKHMGWEDDPQAVLHALRHTFCSRLVQKGAPLKMVQELAGHKRIDMTLRYAHLAPHNLSNCIELLDSPTP